MFLLTAFSLKFRGQYAGPQIDLIDQSPSQSLSEQHVAHPSSLLGLLSTQSDFDVELNVHSCEHGEACTAQ